MAMLNNHKVKELNQKHLTTSNQPKISSGIKLKKDLMIFIYVYEINKTYPILQSCKYPRWPFWRLTFPKTPASITVPPLVTRPQSRLLQIVRNSPGCRPGVKTRTRQSQHFKENMSSNMVQSPWVWTSSDIIWFFLISKTFSKNAQNKSTLVEESWSWLTALLVGEFWGLPSVPSGKLAGL